MLGSVLGSSVNQLNNKIKTSHTKSKAQISQIFQHNSCTFSCFVVSFIFYRYDVNDNLISSFVRNQPDFSQVTLNKFGITYIHDDSETTSDSFTFRAWVAPLAVSSSSSSSSLSAFPSDSSSSFYPLYSASSSSLSSSDAASHHHVKDRLAVTEKFNITVTPVNDQPPLIRSRAPSKKVVVGERVVLGPDSLQVGQCSWNRCSCDYVLI